MAPLLLPIAAIGVAVLARRAVAPAPAGAIAASAAGHVEPPRPSPLAVFCSFLEAKLTPPDLVIVCACAEAELAGNVLLARQIADRYPDVMARRQQIVTGGPALAPPASSSAPAPQAFAPAPEVAPASIAPPAPAAPAAVLAPSPIEGVGDDVWRALCERLIRGDASYNSERRIGRYQHRKDRLREIGFDPESLLGASEAQDAAFAADMADVFCHLRSSGDLAKHVGRPIALPDLPEAVPITLSGLFGVASVAGLEDMAEWLSNKADRKKFPNTTAAFVRANGIF